MHQYLDRGAGDNQWFTAGNWSTGAVPSATDDVCIGPDMSASTTVVLNEEGRIHIDSLTVGGGSGGTQTLAIDTSPVGGGGNDELVLDSLTIQSGTLADGAIDLGSTSTAAQEFTELDAPTGGPAFSNAGHFVSESDGTTASPTSDEFLGLDFTNTGTLEVAGNLNFGPKLVGTPGPSDAHQRRNGDRGLDRLLRSRGQRVEHGHPRLTTAARSPTTAASR